MIKPIILIVFIILIAYNKELFCKYNYQFKPKYAFLPPSNSETELAIHK